MEVFLASLSLISLPLTSEFLFAPLQEDIAQQKQALRGRFQSLLKAQPPEKLSHWSQLIQEKVLASDLFANSQRIALYQSIHSEVDTRSLFQEALKKGKELAFPRTQDSDRSLSFYWIQEERQLSVSRWGLVEPDENLGARPASLEEIELLIIPALAFDRKGFRLGRGKAFYDRTLKSFLGQRLGLAYSFQVLDDLPHDPWDQRVQGIVSEDEWIQTSGDIN